MWPLTCGQAPLHSVENLWFLCWMPLNRSTRSHSSDMPRAFLQLKIFKSIALNGRIVFEEDQFLLIEEECEKRVKQKRQVAERTGNSVFRLKGPHTDCTFSLHFLHYCVHIRPLTQFLWVSKTGPFLTFLMWHLSLLFLAFQFRSPFDKSSGSTLLLFQILFSHAKTSPQYVL